MDIKFKVPTFEYMINSIFEIQDMDQGDYFKESLFYFYPTVEKEKVNSFLGEEKKKYLKDALQFIYKENLQLMQEKVQRYNNYWVKNRHVIVEAFEEAFKMELKDELNDIVGNIALNPVCPRYLESNTFDVFYLNSEKGALGMALHEIVHFVWFKVWNQYFKDDWCDYETPHLKWIFSEMIPDIIMRDERLRARNPYFDDGCVYDYFYKISIDGEVILNTLYNMFQNMPIEQFMVEGYRYCQLNEQTIRSAMDK
jgi:hypothetical protein